MPSSTSTPTEKYRAILAILDGRFLPIDRISIEWGKATEPVMSVGGTKNRLQTSQYYIVLETRRDPRLSLYYGLGDLRVYTHENEIRFQDPTIRSNEYDSSGWHIELQGSGAQMKER